MEEMNKGSYFVAVDYLNYSIRMSKVGKRHEVVLGIRKALKVIRNYPDSLDGNKELKEEVINLLSKIETQPENIINLENVAQQLSAITNVVNLMDRNLKFGQKAKK